ncbi:rubredoxin [Paraburkholderia youngii]
MNDTMTSTASYEPRAGTLWVCVICGWIYDESAGVPEDGIPAGTAWSDVPQDWVCPLCRAGKDQFAMVQL